MGKGAKKLTFDYQTWNSARTHIFLRAGVIHGTNRLPESYSTAMAERDCEWDLSKIRAVFLTKLIHRE